LFDFRHRTKTIFRAYSFLAAFRVKFKNRKENFREMFCPSCGIEEKQVNQFCRACGTDLRAARKVLEMPDTITASAASAREEIGRAFAAKIREAQTGADLKIVAEDVLPEIEKFLESPEEKRLRRMRVGTLISLIGLGAMFAFAWVAAFIRKDDFIIIAGLGMVAFFIGLSFVINGILLTVPKKKISDKSSDAEHQREIDAHSEKLNAQTNELFLPEANQTFSSVTENTTQHLKEKQPVRR
jgi:hypothetical protein